MKTCNLFVLAATLVLLASSLAPLSVAAQPAPLQLTTWDVQVWPEYDEPAVLVIVTGSIDPATIFPQQLRISIPSGARLHAVAYPDETGNLLTLPWTIEPGDDDQTVVFDLDQPGFVVEYYTALVTPPPSRSFDLNLVAPYATGQSSLALRQPARASAMRTTPALVPGGLDALGNPTYTLELGALEAGQSVPLQVSYTKADADPSVSGLAVAETPTVGSTDGQNWRPLIVGVAVGVLAGAVGIYLVTRRRSLGSSRQARRRDARKQGVQPVRSPFGGAAPASSPTRFCVQCGQKFEGSDKFCRNCGAPRR
jgi:hypothetical protein